MRAKNKIKMLRLQVKIANVPVNLVCIELCVEDVLLINSVRLSSGGEIDKKVLCGSSIELVG